MLRLFNKKKEHLSTADFVAAMLSFQQEVMIVLPKEAQSLFGAKIDAKNLQFECEVLSLWTLSLAIQDDGLRDIIHEEYCRHRNFDNDTIKHFYGYLKMRYEQYYDAFKEFAKDPEAGGLMFGSVVANGLKGGENDTRQWSLIEAFAAFSLVSFCCGKH